MAWHIIAAHHVAQLQPTLTAGTATTGYPHGNIRTLGPNQRASITPDGVNGVKVDFNRGGSTGAALNAILVLSNTMSGGNWSVLSDDNSGFSSATTVIAATASPTTDIYKRFDSGATNTEQYLRFQWDQTAGGPYEFGVLSFGVAYQVATKGPLITTENQIADPGAFRRWARSFIITRANAETLLHYASHEYINDSGNTRIDAFGGKGGRNPIALVDDSTSPATVYYGPARVTEKAHAANYSELFVEMDTIRRGLF